MKKTVFSLLSAMALLSVMLVSASAQALSPIDITGIVTKFRKATCASAGTITIGGVTLTIPPGVDVGFTVDTLSVNANGVIVNIRSRAEDFQVVCGQDGAVGVGSCMRLPEGGYMGPGTVRRLIGYVDALGQLQLQIGSALARLPQPTSIPFVFDVTGAANVVGNTIVIGGLTFQLGAGVTVPAFAPGTVVRITGRLDGNNLLIGPAATPGALQVRPAFTTIARFCDAALDLFSAGTSFSGGTLNPGGIFVVDVNPGDAPGPITGGIGNTNPLGTTFSALFRCAGSVDFITFEGRTGLFVNPGFNLRPLVWTFKPACFVFQVDQFNWIVGATVTPNP